MSDLVKETSEEEVIEDNARYWGNRVRKLLLQAEKEITSKVALNTLSILDAEYSITDRYDTDEYDAFLDEFEGAIKSPDKKKKVLSEHTKGGKETDSESENE